ncbi:MAG: signal recognition particle subunit SRP19/SEC65 family protein [Pyrobaculum sp.]
MKKKGGRVLWLVYIDANVPKSRGRIVPRHLAVEKPTLQEAAKALERLGYKYEVAPDKRYPPLWYEERLRGYIVVETREKITTVAKKVCEELRKMRS